MNRASRSDYRLVRHRTPGGTEWFAFHIAYYKSGGDPFLISKGPVIVTGDTPHEAAEVLSGMIGALTKPILNYQSYSKE